MPVNPDVITQPQPDAKPSIKTKITSRFPRFKRGEQTSREVLEEMSNNHGAKAERADDLELSDILKGKVERTGENGGPQEFYEVVLPSGEHARVTFKSREEIIDPTVFTEKHVVRLGKDPLWFSADTFATWEKQFDGKNHARMEGYIQSHMLDKYAQDGGLSFIIDQDMESIAEAALLLGAQNPQVREFYHQARQMRYSDALEGAIDDAIAARIVQTDGTINPSAETHDGEALLLSKFLGDTAAQKIITDRRQIYDAESDRAKEDARQKNHDSNNEFIASHKEDPTRKDAEPMKLEDLVAVHATKYYPTFDKERNRWVVKTLYDATNGLDGRMTVHVALNHVVSSHAGGNWNEMPIIIATPLQDLIAENGVPYNLNTVDTFWVLNPGQDLVLPENTKILVPGTTPEGVDVGDADPNKLTHKYPPVAREAVNYRAYDTSSLQALRVDFDPMKTTRSKISESLGDFALMRGMTQEEINRYNELDDKIREGAEKTGEMRNKAVREVIEDMGFQYRDADARGWHDDNYGLPNYRLNLLADKLGTQLSEHQNSVVGVCEMLVENLKGSIEQLTGRIEYVYGGVMSNHDFDRFLDEDLMNIPPAQRRMLWTYGIL